MPETHRKVRRTYSFRAEVEEEEDGRWSAWIDALPGCAAWGYSQEEALQALKDAAEAYVKDMVDAGERIPDKEQSLDSSVVAVTV